MVDRSISVSCVVAYILWALSLALWCAAWVVGLPPLGQLAIIMAAAAATATVRTYFVAMHQRMKAALAVTSSVREGGAVRPMR